MSEELSIDVVWQNLDRVLLLAVACLLGVCWWESRLNQVQAPLETMRAHAASRPAPAVRPSPPAPVVSVAESRPVSLTQNRMSLVARAMAENGWEGVPETPVADMREANGFYDILFALPDSMDPASVKVSTSGNVLTLFVNGSGTTTSTFVKRFYIPCGAERLGAVETSVSNAIVRVRVRQPGS